MVSGTYGNALMVEKRTKVERMDKCALRGIDIERNNACLGLATGIDMYTGNARERFFSISSEVLLVRQDPLPSAIQDILYGNAPGIGTDIIGCTCLKAVRERVIGSAGPADMFDHLSATLIRRQLLKPVLLAIEQPYAGRTVHLMCRAGKEIAVKIRNIDRQMRCRLRTVDADRYALGVCQTDDLLNGVDDSQHVAYVCYTDELGAWREQGAERIDIKSEIVAQRYNLEYSLLALTEHLPGNDVRVVLKGRDDNLVTLTDERLTKAEREHVNRLGGTAGEKNLGRCRSAYELRQSGTRLFVFGGSKLAEVMRATVDIRIPGGISLGDSINNDLRLL